MHGLKVFILFFLVASMLWFPSAGEAFGWPRKEKPVFTPDSSQVPEELKPAMEDLNRGRLDAAMAGFWTFMQGREGHEHGYGLAAFSLAETAHALGLEQMATEYHAEMVRASMEPDLSLLALQRLESITQKECFDETGIVEELLYEKEFGLLTPEMNNFVHYYQALMDLRNGHPRWAAGHFVKMELKDTYYHRARILQALWALKEQDTETSLRLLEEVAREPDIDRSVKNEAKKSMARLLYERGDFQGAYRLYREIEAPELTLADVILEEAWTAFRQKDYSKAIGLLVAFSAPSFQHIFKPDHYLLEALIYMHFCHYRTARETLLAFKMRYGGLLKLIKSRGDISRDPQARQILEDTPSIQKIDRYRTSLEEETSRVESLPLPEEMKQDILRIYRLKRIRVERVRKRAWKKEVDKLKQVLFDTEEQINLLTYEAGMDRYQKVKEMYSADRLRDKSGPQKGLPRFSRNTYYLFDGEYWNDELDDYTFFIEDYCQTPEQWVVE